MSEQQEPRWYCVSKDGDAISCLTKEDVEAVVPWMNVNNSEGAPHRAVQLVDAAEVERLQAEIDALKSAQRQPAQQPTQKPYGWHVTGTTELICGADAESEAAQRAKQCGGASQAIALYANPPDTASAPQQATELVDAELEACSALMADLRSKSRNHLFRSALKIAELELRARMDQSQRNHPQKPSGKADPQAGTPQPITPTQPTKTLWDEFFLAVVQALIADETTKLSQQLIATAGDIANVMMEVRDLKNHALKAEGGGV